jgi:hypothetical protein
MQQELQAQQQVVQDLQQQVGQAQKQLQQEQEVRSRGHPCCCVPLQCYRNSN